MTPEELKKKMVYKIMEFIPDMDEFEHMMKLAPDDFVGMTDVGPRPVFPYSREDVEKMTKEEYRVAFAKWENERYERWEDNKYYSFRDCNSDWLNDIDVQKVMELYQLCQRIKRREVSYMDIGSGVHFEAKGIYFNKDKKLVIYNGR